MRVAVPRLGVVLSKDGGALEQWRCRSASSSRAARWERNGRQVMSWIHRDDLVAMIVAMVEDPRWRGVYNATAPFPTSNRAFGKALGHALHRPSFLPTPGLALRACSGRSRRS